MYEREYSMKTFYNTEINKSIYKQNSSYQLKKKNTHKVQYLQFNYVDGKSLNTKRKHLRGLCFNTCAEIYMTAMMKMSRM